MKKYVYGIAIAMLGVFITSCSNDDNKDNIKPVEQREGRFDKTAFTWDWSSHLKRDMRYIDDSKYLVDGDIVNYSGSVLAYPGAVFSKESIDESKYDAEIRTEKNPYDLMFMYYRPLIVNDIVAKSGIVTYNRVFNQSVDSEEFKSEVARNSKGSEYSYFTECYTYNDVVKLFSNNKKLGEVFVKKMKENAGNNRYKSIYLMRVGKVFYDEFFEASSDGFFKDPIDVKNLYYIKRVTRGTPVTYIAVESKAEYNDLKGAVLTAYDYYKANGNVNIGGEYGKILDNASFTVLNPSQWSKSKNDMFSVLDTKLSAGSPGTMVYLDIRSVEKDEFYNKK
ncbi:hypothetical protein [Myroides sp.]|uniref:hypothetical protein n=1 Tax=Myroides sp. TaxID=1874736 RepID=UPI003F357182